MLKEVGQPAGSHLGPVVLVSIIKLESDETHRDELNGAPPELTAHLCISSKSPARTLTMSCNDCGVVDHLTQTHKAVPNADETLLAIDRHVFVTGHLEVQCRSIEQVCIADEAFQTLLTCQN